MPKKAQMFLITMIFLAGLVFFVQQLLFQYSFLDMSSPLQKNDVYFLESVKNMVNKSLEADNCEEAETNLQELDRFLKIEESGIYLLELRYNNLEEPNLVCTNWGTPASVLTLQVRLISSETDTLEVFEYYS